MKMKNNTTGKRKVNETFLCVFLYSAESRRDEYKTTRQI